MSNNTLLLWKQIIARGGGIKFYVERVVNRILKTQSFSFDDKEGNFTKLCELRQRGIISDNQAWNEINLANQREPSFDDKVISDWLNGYLTGYENFVRQLNKYGDQFYINSGDWRQDFIRECFNKKKRLSDKNKYPIQAPFYFFENIVISNISVFGCRPQAKCKSLEVWNVFQDVKRINYNWTNAVIKRLFGIFDQVPEYGTPQWINYHYQNILNGITKSTIELGKYYISKNDCIKAVKYYSAGFDDDKYKLEIVRTLIDISWEAGDYSSALKFVNLLENFNRSEAYLLKSFLYEDHLFAVNEIKNSFESLVASVEQGNARALYLVGNCYFYGYKVKQDFKAALRCYELASEKGEMSAAYCAGIIYLNGLNVEKSREKGIEFLRLSAMKGHSGAEFVLGKIGESCGQKTPRALLLSAAYKGNPDALNLYAKTDDRLNKVEKFFLYTTAASMGCANAITNMIDMSQKSMLVSLDFFDEGHLIQLAANKGDPDAVCKLSQYLSGDKKLSALRTAARAGSAMALNALGEMYLRGDLVQRSTDSAFRLFSKAAELNYPEAYIHLGDMFNDGIGVAQSKTKAKEFYRKASQLGSWEAVGKIATQTLDDCFSEMERVFAAADQQINKIINS